jgi:hypothetical protein
VSLRLGPLRIPWPGKEHAEDPYWERFINTPPADIANSVVDMVRRAPEGNIFPTKAELHTPEITTSHVKELALYLGADLVGIARLEGRDAAEEAYPFAVVTAVRADQDPATSRGIGGQVPVQNGLYVTFVLSAWIRELGFRSTAKSETDTDADRVRIAAAARIGTLNAEGRLVTPKFGTRVYVADLIRTDLPLAADG